ncbi:sporulation protein YjcZ [Bacillus sp. MYb209]|nr:sporulation protein YjcZ [Bacillus sp. MYb209]
MTPCFILLSKGGTIMGFGGSCGSCGGGGFAGGFALLVVLFILLIIVGASCFC